MDWGKVSRPQPVIRRPAAQPPKAAAPPMGYEEFCAKCEGCLHLNPCSHAMNTTMACTGDHRYEARA